ncbi:MAG: GTPase domain-containing protein [Anaerolineales bacterium]|nr:GTPase domain-containing protein [Anaerolineales bacterium]
MFINWKLREINLKIVYYGPSLSGKTTSLQYIHTRINPERRGEMVTLKTREDRTLYFDFMQFEMGKVAGLKPRFNLYTVPGQIYYRSTRKLVLKGVDGIVFVADSQQKRLRDNIRAVKDLGQDLVSLGFQPQNMPIILQCNKRDLTDIVPVLVMKEKLGMKGVPTYETVATEGTGVVEGLKKIINHVVHHAQDRIGNRS